MGLGLGQQQTIDEMIRVDPVPVQCGVRMAANQNNRFFRYRADGLGDREIYLAYVARRGGLARVLMFLR